MTMAISLDIETLSTHKNAVVLTIGATTISLDGSDERTFHLRLDAQEQIDMGRHVSISTIAWWMNQTAEAKRAAFEGHTVSARTALELLRTWIAEEGHPPIYTNGPAFDGAILETLAEDCRVMPAWSYRQHRCYRTVEESILMVDDEALYDRFSARKTRIYEKLVAHNALEDAKAQGEIVRFWMKELRGE